jgi:NitT/TauT family transport system permease protein
MTVPDGKLEQDAILDLEAAPRASPPGGSLKELGGWPMLACQAALGIVVLLIWQGASGRLVDNFFISNPLDVGARLYGWIMDGSIFRHLAATVYATAMGFFIGAVGGAILGVWLGVSPFASRLLNPYLNALNALPKVALAPLFVLWFGLGLESKIALAAVLVLFLVFLNTFAGVREVDQDLIDGARLMRATRAQVITKVIIPSAMSWVFAGLKISVPYALIGAVLGEMIAANRGLGYLVQFSGAQFDSAGVFAVLFVIALLAVALNFLVEIVQHRMERWRIVGR